MDDPNSILEDIKAAIRRSDTFGERGRLDQLVFDEPDNELAWLLLAVLVENENERADCLAHALAVNPEYIKSPKIYNQVLHLKVESTKTAKPAAAPVKIDVAAGPVNVDEKVEVDPFANPSPYADDAELKSAQLRIGWKRTHAAQEMYSEAVSAARQGDRLKAEALLDELVAQQPEDVQARWVLAQVASGDEKVVKCLHQVLEIAPNHIGASRRLDELRAKKVKENES
jgi:hypothetical protein